MTEQKLPEQSNSPTMVAEECRVFRIALSAVLRSMTDEQIETALYALRWNADWTSPDGGHCFDRPELLAAVDEIERCRK